MIRKLFVLDRSDRATVRTFKEPGKIFCSLAGSNSSFGWRLVVVIVAGILVAATHDFRAADNWVTFESCSLISNPANDGDSFHVLAQGKEYIFRLYFVDAPETDEQVAARVREQARYFKISRRQVLRIGEAARFFTRERLATPFTVRTCFEDAMGQSRLERFYALVTSRDGDLGEQLVGNGLARAYGATAPRTDFFDGRMEWRRLRRLEREAKEQKAGAWSASRSRR
jgi:endonuclease YncB( thermonuclease family)